MLLPTRSELESQTVLRGRNRTYHYHNTQPELSIKTMANGHAIYDIEGARFAVEDTHFLILNAWQDYIIDIESPTVVESFCIFFPHGWAEEVERGLTMPDEHLLDSASDGQLSQFFEQLYPHDNLISPMLWEVRAALHTNTVTSGWLEEKLRGLLAAMLHLQRGVYRQIETMPAARPSTRVELYRRLHLARDFMHASLGDPLSLNEIAAQVALSPYHFLRAFKQVFGLTPHAYLTQKRLERACFLLRNTDAAVTEICFTVGFESLGSFSALFQRNMGLSPRAYRLAR
jgi:AraC-like DNA-binding protein